jgi:Predicted nucleic acid-binding protein, contains PIN domain
MIELLNYFSEFGADMRLAVAETVRDIMIDLEIEYILHSPGIFLDALGLYEKRLDKGYSLTDCISMNICRKREISDIITHDEHFEQEGFVILM